MGRKEFVWDATAGLSGLGRRERPCSVFDEHLDNPWQISDRHLAELTAQIDRRLGNGANGHREASST
jgi:hypothetical protein